MGHTTECRDQVRMQVSVALQAEKDFQEKEKDKFQDIVWEWRNSTQLFAKKLKDILNLISKQVCACCFHAQTNAMAHRSTGVDSVGSR